MSGAPHPWLRFYGRVPATLDYPRTTLYERVAETARARSPRSALVAANAC
jgi:hypothetical protein